MTETADAGESMVEQEARSRCPTTAPRTRLRERLGVLEKLDAGQLRAEWRRLYRSQAPRLSRDLLGRIGNFEAHNSEQTARRRRHRSERDPSFRSQADFRAAEAIVRFVPKADVARWCLPQAV
jgi:hypothetical protein